MLKNVILRSISAALFEYTDESVKRLKAAKPIRHWQRSEEAQFIILSVAKKLLNPYNIRRQTIVNAYCSKCYAEKFHLLFADSKVSSLRSQ